MTSLGTTLCRSFNLARLDNAFLGYEAVTSVVGVCWGVMCLAHLTVQQPGAPSA